MTLGDLKPAQRATVTAVNAVSSVSQRLTMLGVLPGARVEMVRYAPLGDPITFTINGQHFSLRRVDAESVQVKP